ncbi:MAG TPA: trypsin-like peptidase domain-containing protein [Blastocatellia bacterium]|nr:trypsin-like peptidase domain-containing protein [Blastocatellia bacterium]
MNKRVVSTSIGLLLLQIVPTVSAGSRQVRPPAQVKTADRPDPATQNPSRPAEKPRNAAFMVDVPAIVERVNPIVVNVRSSGDSGENLGSGFIIDPRGLIITNLHLITANDSRRAQGSAKGVKLADRVWVTMNDGRQFAASVKGYDEATDIAVLEIVPQGKPLPAADLGDSDVLKVGEWVLAIGNPLGLDHTVTLGILSAKGRTDFGGQFDDFLQTDAAINPGNSGGPLVNTNGQIIGINTLILERSQGLSFSIPVNTLKAILPQLVERGRVTRGYLGLESRDVNPDLRGLLNLPADSSGVVVVRAERGTPAARAGLRQNDLITTVDQQSVTSRVQFNRIVSSKLPGEKVSLRIIREGKEYTLTAEVSGEAQKNQD